MPSFDTLFAWPSHQRKIHSNSLVLSFHPQNHPHSQNVAVASLYQCVSCVKLLPFSCLPRFRLRSNHCATACKIATNGAANRQTMETHRWVSMSGTTQCCQIFASLVHLSHLRSFSGFWVYPQSISVPSLRTKLFEEIEWKGISILRLPINREWYSDGGCISDCQR